MDYKIKLNSVIKEVFDELKLLTPDDFKKALDDAKDTPRAKAILYAMNPNIIDIDYEE